MTNFNVGDKVTCNGNSDARIIKQVSDNSYEVRLWAGTRLVGSVVVSKRDLLIENK